MSRAGRFCCCCCCFLGVLWTLRSGSGKRFPGHEASEECKPGFSSTPLKTLPLSSPRAGQVLTLSLHYSIWTLTLQSRELNKPYPGHLLPGELCCVNSLLIQCVFKPRRFATTQTAGSHCWVQIPQVQGRFRSLYFYPILKWCRTEAQTQHQYWEDPEPCSSTYHGARQKCSFKESRLE